MFRFLTEADPIEIAVIVAVANRAEEIELERMKRLARQIRNELVAGKAL